jgi:hypothetical protein
MQRGATSTYSSANLRSTAILDFESDEIRAFLRNLLDSDQSARSLVQRAHLSLCESVRPVYSLDELQSASETLRNKAGSCSQRMACLEAVARAAKIPTRVRALHVKGSFWYPRFRFLRPFVPERILLVWPQFFFEATWVDFDELHSSMERLVEDSFGFTNDGESLFEAVRQTPVDFLGKSCGLACSKPEHDLSKYVLSDDGFFDTRDEAFEQLGSFQHTLSGRLFGLVFGR